MNPWDITRREHDPLSGLDIVHFADGHRMPVPPVAPGLNSLATGADWSPNYELHRRISKDPLAHLIAGTLAEELADLVKTPENRDQIARASLLLAGRVRDAAGMRSQERES